MRMRAELGRWLAVALVALAPAAGVLAQVQPTQPFPGGQAAPGQPTAPQAAPRPQPPRQIMATLGNDGDLPLTEAFVSSTRQDSWGENRLATPLAPRARLRLALPRAEGCQWDARFVWADGREQERRNLDLCREPVLAMVPPALESRRIALANRRGADIVELFARPAGTERWGADLLGSATLGDGDDRDFEALLPGCEADLRLTYEAGAEERFRIDLCEAPAVAVFPGWTTAQTVRTPPSAATQPAAASGSIEVRNRSGRVVFSLYAFPSGSDSEGLDRLGSDTLADGGDLDIAREPAECRWSFRLTWEDGGRGGREDVDVCADPTVVIGADWAEDATAEEVGMPVRNAGPVPMVSLHVVAQDGTEGPDLLGDGVLGVGQTVIVPRPAPEACLVDLLARFRDGRVERREDIDLCGEGEVVLP